MDVVIEIDEKYLKVAAATVVMMFSSDDAEKVQKALDACKGNTVKINPDVFGEESNKLSLSLAIMCILRQME